MVSRTSASRSGADGSLVGGAAGVSRAAPVGRADGVLRCVSMSASEAACGPLRSAVVDGRLAVDSWRAPMVNRSTVAVAGEGCGAACDAGVFKVVAVSAREDTGTHHHTPSTTKPTTDAVQRSQRRVGLARATRFGAPGDTSGTRCRRSTPVGECCTDFLSPASLVERPPHNQASKPGAWACGWAGCTPGANRSGRENRRGLIVQAQRQAMLRILMGHRPVRPFAACAGMLGSRCSWTMGPHPAGAETGRRVCCLGRYHPALNGVDLGQVGKSTSP